MELQFKNVTKDYGNVHAVEHVTHSMGKGVYGLLGVNGAGKTTLMRMICTAITPTSGEILWNGKDIFSLGASYREILGYLPQSYGFYPDLSVYDYMLYIASIKGIRPIMAKKRALKLLEQVGMAEKRKRKMRTLSGGMIRRVGIAQAMLNDPRILVLDEPTAGVDINLRHSLWTFMEELNRKGHTIILTTHYLEEAERLCRNVAMLNHGRIAALENTRDLLKEYSKDRVVFTLSAPLPSDFPIQVEKLQDGFYCLNYDTPEGLRILLDELHKRGLEPEGLELGKANLEEVFMRITSK